MTPVRKPCFADTNDSIALQPKSGEHQPGLDFR